MSTQSDQMVTGTMIQPRDHTMRIRHISKGFAACIVVLTLCLVAVAVVAVSAWQRANALSGTVHALKQAQEHNFNRIRRGSP